MRWAGRTDWPGWGSRRGVSRRCCRWCWTGLHANGGSMPPAPRRNAEAMPAAAFRVYLVGGAVRDELLGRAHGDRDYVVVGATPQTLLDLGYKPVGKDFPVFLHPDTGEEYALARTERKTGRGYHGFAFHADPDVTLEQDLARRDRRAGRSLRRREGPERSRAASRVAGFRRGPGAHPARGAFPRALCAAGIPDRRRDHDADARDGRGRRGRTPGARTRVGGNPQGADRTAAVRVPARAA